MSPQGGLSAQLGGSYDDHNRGEQSLSSEPYRGGQRLSWTPHRPCRGADGSHVCPPHVPFYGGLQKVFGLRTGAASADQ
jgi:hypothetical protein